MNRRLLVMLVVVAVTVSGCSDGGGDDLAGYFDSVSEATAGYAADVAVLPVAATNASLDDVRSHFRGVDEAIDLTLTRLLEIEPPQQVAATHPGLLDAVEAFKAVTAEVVARADMLETQQDLIQLANDATLGVGNYNRLEAEIAAACLVLQTVANDSNIEVDLHCESLGDG